MTALTKYDRLESPGLWRDQPNAQRREVIIGLREATLVFSDPKSELPLSQWSLPAIIRLNPGTRPALYGPGQDAVETIELDDDQMIDALEMVHRVLERRKPHPGRLRNLMIAGTSVASLAFVFLWLPSNLNRYAAKMLPEPTQILLGDAALSDIARITGSPCSRPAANLAINSLMIRLFGPDKHRLFVVRDGLSSVTVLPGGVIVAPTFMLEQSESAEILAGYIFEASLNPGANAATEGFLDHAGLWSTIKLLTTGEWPQQAAYGYAETILTAQNTTKAPVGDLLQAFRSAEISTQAYVYRLRETNAAIDPALVEQDPMPIGTLRPILSDEHWLALQSICLN
jgi:hypothetical protein